MNYQAGDYLFEIALSTPKRFPAYLKTALRKAGAAALTRLPRRVLEVKCDTATRYLLSLAIVDTKTIHRLNKTYRKKDKPTDVLSFSRLEGETFPSVLREVGDVVICEEVARRQAKEYGVSLAEELQRLTVHGVLHLFGYDHERSKEEARRMFALQRRILKSLVPSVAH